MAIFYLFKRICFPPIGGLLLLAAFLVSTSYNAMGQVKVITGKVTDEHSDEVIPFASISFSNAKIGKISDSSGYFHFRFNAWPADSIIITRVGYKPFVLAIDKLKDSVFVDVVMVRGSFGEEIVVKSKFNKGLYVWKKIVQNKDKNDRFRYDNYAYEIYNKLELDLKNINFNKIAKLKPLQNIGKIINDNIDSFEGTFFLPTYLTESISDYYFQKKPEKRREIIKASNTKGVNNESVNKFLGGTDQVINIYENFIQITDKQFVSPVSSNGDYYYKYSVPDTQVISGIKYYHLVFVPRREGTNTFEGDCWVHSKNWGVLKSSLRLGAKANINFVNNLSLIQEYTLLYDSVWCIAKDKFVIDITPLGKNKPAFIGKKTATYKNFIYNSDLITAEINKNQGLKEVIIVEKGSGEKKPDYWDTSRHEDLSKTEAGVIRMIDTLLNNPQFTKLTNNLLFLGTGYKNVGNFEIGPWFNWASYNNWEGYRLRFDIGTNKKFNKHIWWHTYLAYGFKDKTIKGKAEIFYLPTKHPRRYIYASYINDLDFGQSYYGEVSADNIFALAIRKANVPVKFMKIEEKRLEFFNEHRNGFSEFVSVVKKSYNPLSNLPLKDSFPMDAGYTPLSTFEVSLKLRFAYLEKFLENTFSRYSLGSIYPISEINISKGIKGVWGSSYNYTKLYASISDYMPIPPLGNISYQIYGGKTFGTLPYVLLEIAPGNEMFYYNKYAFNMMNRFEYIHDAYAGVNIEHIVGNGIFRVFPKLKLRQLWTAKLLWGTLTKANENLNFKMNNTFKTLADRPYLEVGTGIDNIFRVFRIDFIWRVLPQTLPNNTTKKFGVFGSFRIAF